MEPYPPIAPHDELMPWLFNRERALKPPYRLYSGQLVLPLPNRQFLWYIKYV